MGQDDDEPVLPSGDRGEESCLQTEGGCGREEVAIKVGVLHDWRNWRTIEHLPGYFAHGNTYAAFAVRMALILIKTPNCHSNSIPANLRGSFKVKGTTRQGHNAKM